MSDIDDVGVAKAGVRGSNNIPCQLSRALRRSRIMLHATSILQGVIGGSMHKLGAKRANKTNSRYEGAVNVRLCLTIS